MGSPDREEDRALGLEEEEEEEQKVGEVAAVEEVEIFEVLGNLDLSAIALGLSSLFKTRALEQRDSPFCSFTFSCFSFVCFSVNDVEEEEDEEVEEDDLMACSRWVFVDLDLQESFWGRATDRDDLASLSRLVLVLLSLSWTFFRFLSHISLPFSFFSSLFFCSSAFLSLSFVVEFKFGLVLDLARTSASRDEVLFCFWSSIFFSWPTIGLELFLSPFLISLEELSPLSSPHLSSSPSLSPNGFFFPVFSFKSCFFSLQFSLIVFISFFFSLIVFKIPMPVFS